MLDTNLSALSKDAYQKQTVSPSGVLTVDDKVLQRILLVSSDEISKVISQNDTELSKQKIIRLSASTTKIADKFEGVAESLSEINRSEGVEVPSYELIPNDQQLAVRRQQELFSDNPVTSDDAAYELLSDNRSSIPIDNSYFLSHHILLYVKRQPVFFNIDNINKLGKIFISKVVIKNESKNIFTLKASYKINLTINFTNFDDLLEENIPVRNVNDSKPAGHIAPIFLLYKFFNTPEMPLSFRHLPDIEGIFLNQTLILNKENSRNKKIIDDLNTNTLSKNYHVTYFKHNLEMFRGEEIVNKKFENELNIEYVAYEIDGANQPMTPEIAKSIAKVNGNLYNLLDGKWRKKLSDVNNTNNNYIQNIYKKYELLTLLSQRYSNALNCDEGTAAAKKIEVLKERIQNLNKDRKNLKNETNGKLIAEILTICRTWSIELPADVVGVYQTDEFWQEFTNRASFTGLLTNLGLEASVGFIAYPFLTAAGIAAAPISVPLLLATAAVYYGYYAIEAHMSSRKIYKKDIDFAGVKSVVYDAIKDEKLSIVENNYNNILPKTTTIKEEESEYTKKRKQIIAEIGRLEVPRGNPATENSKIDIQFTTFGELLKVTKLIDPSGLLHIACGGYLVDLGTGDNRASFVNFADLPITINSLANFLYKFIEETDRNFNYDSEVFLRDCYENLLRNIINDATATLPSLSNTLPNNLRIISTIHAMSDKERWFKDTNLLNERDFSFFKKQFVLSKNFNLTNASQTLGQKKFSKIYVIGTFEQIKYYNFFDEYNKWAGKEDKNQYNSFKFQEYINKKHFMPCLLMRAISNSESLLKKKYVNFSRIDNKHLNTGNFLQGYGQIRYQYEFTSDFKVHTAFFLDIGSHLFIAPPSSKLELLNTGINTFGFGGLYVISSAELEYHFQRIQDGKITLPNFESKYMLKGYMLSHGDSLKKALKSGTTGTQNKSICTDPIPIDSNEQDKELTELIAELDALDEETLKTYLNPL